MIKTLGNSISCLFLAFLILISGSGFSIDLHYCQQNLQNFSFIGKAKSCHETQKKPPCHKTKKSCSNQKLGTNQEEKDNCCHNENLVIEKLDIDATSPQFEEASNVQLNFIYTLVAINLFKHKPETDVQAYKRYKPPIPDSDIQALYQSFLI